MWIRSQDKSALINANEIFIENNDYESFIKCNTQSLNTTGGCIIGNYKNKERCIEILNNIQKELVNYQPALSGQCLVVFEMPEE